MSVNRNPQQEQMADESMVRNLDFQIRAIWPQEHPLFEAYALPRDARVLDVGCGTGELITRLVEWRPTLRELVGVDIEPRNLEIARRRLGHLHPQVQLRLGDAYHLEDADGTYDLTCCRHVLQAIPDAPAVIRELIRVTRPGGRVHLLVEDYGMMFFSNTTLDADRFWQQAVIPTGAATHTDLRVGRRAWTWARAAGLRDVRADYIHLDTVRAPRHLFAGIWTAWRDGYTDFIAAHSGMDRDTVLDYWNDMLRCIEDEQGYAHWCIPIISGVAP